MGSLAARSNPAVRGASHSARYGLMSYTGDPSTRSTPVKWRVPPSTPSRPTSESPNGLGR
eukprot:scaffold27464_cov107-Isochrysis_galbana.AAC.4